MIIGEYIKEFIEIECAGCGYLESFPGNREEGVDLATTYEDGTPWEIDSVHGPICPHCIAEEAAAHEPEFLIDHKRLGVRQ